VVGVLSSAIAAFFYVRVIVLMYFSEPTPGRAATVVSSGPMTIFTVTAGAAVTVILGVWPTVVLQVADKATVFLP